MHKSKCFRRLILYYPSIPEIYYGKNPADPKMLTGPNFRHKVYSLPLVLIDNLYADLSCADVAVAGKSETTGLAADFTLQP